MSLSAGTRLGPYEILAPLGAGGMGEVYKARDTRLDRVVAIKTVSGPFSERFEREARAISALNHPHICTLHDVGEHDGAGYLVMEYVDGTPLAGPLPLARALSYGAEICDALDAAHRKGIIHRDLKPANVLVTKAGVKLLDFGLARIGAGVAGGSVGASETVASASEATKLLTGPHAILGTPQYMAPEQIEGGTVDARADLFSFGCVLYELLTGQRAFEGKSASSVMAAILATQPRPLRELQPVAPLALERLVRRCLAKDPEERWQSARDLRAELQWIASTDSGLVIATMAPVGQRRLLWAVASVLTLATAIALWAPWRRQTEAQPVSFEIHPPEGSFFQQMPFISPDGRLVVLTVRDASGKPSLMLRRLDRVALQPLPDTDGVVEASAWSPDSRSIAFRAGQTLKTFDIERRVSRPLCDCLAGPPHAAWGPDGTILFSVNGEGIHKMSATGGPHTAVTNLDGRERFHQFPQFFPDGRHFLYFARGGVQDEDNAVYVGSLDTPPGVGNRRLVMKSRSSALYSRGSDGSDYLLFERDGDLVAQPLDLDRFTLTGSAVAIARDIGMVGATTIGVSVSNTGGLAYSSGIGGPVGEKQFSWFDRSGKHLADVGPPGQYSGFSLSPDQRRVAVAQRDGDCCAVSILDLERAGAATRLTPVNQGGEGMWMPVWSPLGDRVAFIRWQAGKGGIYHRVSNGSGSEVAIETASRPALWGWSAEGSGLIYGSDGDLFLSKNGDAVPIVQTPALEREAQLSRDGKWMAYVSDESRQLEVYVQSFPKPDTRSIVSIGGGVTPRWSHDGRELFYLAQDGRLMSVPIKPGPVFDVGPPAPLFQTLVLAANPPGSFEPSRDGQRFLLLVPDPRARATPMTVVTDWLALTR